MNVILAGLFGWLSLLVGVPAVQVWRTSGRCWAVQTVDIPGTGAGKTVRCKFDRGHGGKHRSTEGSIW